MGSACADGKYIEYRGFLSNHLSQVLELFSQVIDFLLVC